MLVPPATHLDPAKTGLHGHTYSSLPAHKEIRSLAGMVDTDPEGSSESPLEVLRVEGEPPEFELAAVLGMQFKMGLLPPEADEPGLLYDPGVAPVQADPACRAFPPT